MITPAVRERVTASAICATDPDHPEQGHAAAQFPAGPKGPAYLRAARELADRYDVEARQPYRVNHYNPASADAPPPTADPRRLELTGTPEALARYLSALLRALEALERLATVAARQFGRWTRSAAAEPHTEYEDADGLRTRARNFRAEVFTALPALLLAPPTDAPPQDERMPLWRQADTVAAAVAAARPVDLTALDDADEVRTMLAYADRTPDSRITQARVERRQLIEDDVRRSCALRAALDGEDVTPYAPDTPSPAAQAPANDHTDHCPAADPETQAATAIKAVYDQNDVQLSLFGVDAVHTPHVRPRRKPRPGPAEQFAAAGITHVGIPFALMDAELAAVLREVDQPYVPPERVYTIAA